MTHRVFNTIQHPTIISMKNITKTLLIAVAILCSFAATATPRLSSLQNAEATIYFDFDGHTVNHPFWNGGMTLNCAPSGLTDEQIYEIFNRVSEDYRPFNINITTDSTVFLNAPLNMRSRVIVTPTSGWYPGVGGVAFIGSFVWGDDTPGFVFSDRLQYFAKYIAECCTHESGHTVGLSHQSRYDDNCNLIEPYSQGVGTGETSWAPVMGNSYYRNMTGWNDGPTPYGCSLVQDNLTIITTMNGFGYREDDHGDLLTERTFELPELSFSESGIIATSNDKDPFRYTTSRSGWFHFQAKPFGFNNSTAGANLDIQVEIYNSSRQLINTYNPVEKMDVSIDTMLNAGTYYFVISGAGNANISNYGSLGSYTITGAAGPLAIHDIALTGQVENQNHTFNWNIVADEPITTQVLEGSTDGTSFETIATMDGNKRGFTYRPGTTGELFYRLKVTSVINETAISNTVRLKVPARDKPFRVPTTVRSQIRIQGNEAFDYALADMSGKMIFKGKGMAGTYNISSEQLASGVYVLIIRSATTKQTERIIKQ
ncbi:MAG: T9SS type A sorting domain-containing protein [Chitinophagaceae bacterium]|nr:MAG: T9SS type A sorting domain-containing protein [Chitinophagaceae bacterium]